MLLRTAAEEFLNYLVVELNRSNLTQSGYRKDLNVFLRFLERNGQGDITLQELTPEHVSAYIRHLSQDKGSKPNTLRRHVTTLKSFGQFLVDSEYLPRSPAASLERPRMPQKQPRYLQQQEVNKLFEAVPDNGLSSAMRDKTVLKCLYYTGLRVSELVKLRREDVDLEEDMLKVAKGKGGKFRKVPLHQELKLQLERYLVAAPALINGYLFCNREGARISADYVHYMIGEYAKKAGLTKSVTPHMLRHSFATKLYREGIGLPTLGKLLGHTSIRSTTVYTHTDIKHLQEAVGLLNVSAKLESEIVKLEADSVDHRNSH